MLRIFFDEPDEAELEELSDTTGEEADAVISEYQSPTGSYVYFPESAHDGLIEGLTQS